MFIFVKIVWCLILSNFTVAAIQIFRQLSKAGFHRELETVIQLPIDFGSECSNASLLMYETLPSGMYADPFQLRSLEEFGGPKTHFRQAVDIEAAEFASEPLDLYVFLNASSFTHNVQKDVLESRVTVPVHARYHQVSSLDSHAVIVILPPTLYKLCQNDQDFSDSHSLSAPCSDSDSNVCEWSRLTYKIMSPPLEMKVPVGQASHKPVVILVTLLVSIVVSVVLTKVIVSHQRKEKVS